MRACVLDICVWTRRHRTDIIFMIEIRVRGCVSKCVSLLRVCVYVVRRLMWYTWRHIHTHLSHTFQVLPTGTLVWCTWWHAWEGVDKMNYRFFPSIQDRARSKPSSTRAAHFAFGKYFTDNVTTMRSKQRKITDVGKLLFLLVLVWAHTLAISASVA